MRPVCPTHGIALERTKEVRGEAYRCLAPGCETTARWSRFDSKWHFSTPGARDARRAVHAALDALWKSGRMSRVAAYRALAKGMGMGPAECHVAHFDEETCKRALEVVESMRRRR